MKHTDGAILIVVLLGIFCISFTTSQGQGAARLTNTLHRKPASTADSDVLSSNFWRNAKEKDFDRVFLPHGLSFDDLSPAQQKKVWYLMFKKAIKARQNPGMVRPAITFKESSPTNTDYAGNEISRS
ncbi:uncharacterized protein LOC129583712 [Paramacrobiotus metropolitanus]|uniref:uncharacterized protein LOC129583712 n=1 Tax=Paramacrobiotus metropolitanus TaxID=2943436 RepID=UPI0024465A38|nr:uncharacterized protein LOC129583712 [Paramacrobiotus metropolitanus]